MLIISIYILGFLITWILGILFLRSQGGGDEDCSTILGASFLWPIALPLFSLMFLTEYFVNK